MNWLLRVSSILLLFSCGLWLLLSQSVLPQHLVQRTCIPASPLSFDLYCVFDSNNRAVLEHSFPLSSILCIIYIWSGKKMFHGLQQSSHLHTSVKLFAFQSSHCSPSSPFLTRACVFPFLKTNTVWSLSKHLCWILSTLKVGHRVYGKEHFSFIEIKTLWYIENWWLFQESHLLSKLLISSCF